MLNDTTASAIASRFCVTDTAPTRTGQMSHAAPVTRPSLQVTMNPTRFWVSTDRTSTDGPAVDSANVMLDWFGVSRPGSDPSNEVPAFGSWISLTCVSKPLIAVNSVVRFLPALNSASVGDACVAIVGTHRNTRVEKTV